MDKRRLQRSPIWELFQKVNEQKKLAKCSLCSKILSYSTTVTNLKKHLQRHGFSMHPERTEEASVPNDEEDQMNVNTIWAYFTKTTDEDMVKCVMCEDRLRFETESCLFEHLKEKHKDIVIVDGETDAESAEEAGPGRKDSRTSPLWKYFSVLDLKKRLARCLFCMKALSYSTSSSNLKRHLIRNHITSEDFERCIGEQTFNLSSTRCEDGEDTIAKCNLCLEQLPDESQQAFIDHLKEKHRVARDLEDGDATECESDELDYNDYRGRVSAVWKYCTVVDKKQMLAECDLCGMKLSYLSTVSNLKKHLLRKHNLDPHRDQRSPHNNHQKKKMLSLWEYFTKSFEEEGVRCKLCEVKIEKESEESLLLHLSQRHGDVGLAPTTTTTTSSKVAVRRSSKSRMRHSPVWKYFEIVDEEGGVARCLLCERRLSFMGTVTNLKKHLTNRHRIELPSHESNYMDRSEKRGASPIREYFQKGEGGAWECRLCEGRVQPGDERTLLDHLREKHFDEQMVDTDVEDDLCEDEAKEKKKMSKVWSHFTKTSITNKMAECKLCKMAVSFEKEGFLIGHLREQHSLDKQTDNTYNSKQYMVSDSGELFEFEEDAPQQEENAIYIEEYKEPRNSRRKRKRTRVDCGDDDDDDERSSPGPVEDHLNIYEGIKEADSRDESLEYFGKYIISLLKELPKDLSRKLQLDFIMQINEARARKRKTRESSSD